MANMRDELTLVDRFTATWDKFIAYTERAVNQARAVEESTGSLGEAFQAAGSSARDSFVEVFPALEGLGTRVKEAFFGVDESVDQISDSATRIGDAFEQTGAQAAEGARNFMEILDQLEEAGVEFSDALRLAEQAALGNAEAIQAIADATQGATDAVDDFVESEEEINEATRRFSGFNLPRIFRNSGDEAERAANGGFNNLLNKITKISAGLLTLRGIKGLLSDALAESTYEVKFRAVFGDDYGLAAMDWVRQTANELGRTTQQIADATSQFTKLTTNPANLDKLNELSDKFARWSRTGDFAAASNGINQALRTGRLRELSASSGITVGQLEQFGVGEAAKAGDLDAFITGLERAAEAAGLTQEAYEKLLESPQASLERFTNTFKNSAVAAAGAFITAFAPAFDRLNEFLQSDTATRFFGAFSAAATLAGTIASAFLSILIGVADFVGDHLVEVFIAAGIAASIWAGQMIIAAVAALFANTQLLLLVAILAVALLALHALGVGAEDVFGFIGGLIGALYATAYNIVVDLWNLIASFAEFFANVFNDPVGSIVRLFHSLFDTILGILQSAAEAIDFVFGSNLAGGLESFRGRVSDWVTDLVGEPQISIDRMDRIDFSDTVNNFAAVGRDFGRKIDELDLSLDGLSDLGDLPDFGDFIGSDNLVPVNVKKNSDKISLADEDLRLFVDLAERKYVAQVNLSTIAPKINVKVTNNGQDPIIGGDLARQIQIILEEEAANHSDGTYDIA